MSGSIIDDTRVRVTRGHGEEGVFSLYLTIAENIEYQELAGITADAALD